MTRRGNRPTKIQLLAGLLALGCSIGALLGALFHAWIVVVAMLVVILGEILAAVLMMSHVLSGRINRAGIRVDRHISHVEKRYLAPLERSIAKLNSFDGQATKPTPARTTPAPKPITAATTQSLQQNVQISSIGSESELVRRVAIKGSGELRTFILQNKAYSMLEIIAQAAHPSRPSLTTLLETVRLHSRALRDPVATAFLRDCAPLTLLDLADILASARPDATALEDSITLTETVAAIHGHDTLTVRAKIVLIESLVDAGRTARLDERITFLDIDNDGAATGLLRANSLLPIEGDSSRNWRAWANEVNRVFLREDIEPITVPAGSNAPFDRLRCVSEERVDGPLVTVVVPTYEADDRFDTAMVSIVGQTWRNLQIVVVDDATLGGIPEVVQAWARRDPRVTIVRRERNCGTYANRNYVLHHVAAGEFFTVHDDDDWSHPRKIQLQVEHLLRTGEVANVSQRARATNDLLFRRTNNNINYVQMNFSSLMISTAQMKEHLGGWDEVNRSADGEFIDRFISWQGKAVASVSQAPLSFQRVRDGSLSSDEVSRGYIDSRRKWYELTSKEWHRACLRSEDTHPFRYDAARPRAFSAPIDLLVAPNTRGGEYRADIAFMGDFRGTSPAVERVCSDVVTLTADGKGVVLVQINSPENSWQAAMSTAVAETALLPGVTVCSVLDTLECETLVLFDPVAVQYLEEGQSRVIGDDVVLVEPVDLPEDGVGATSDLNRVRNACVRVFGVMPRVVPDATRLSTGDELTTDDEECLP